MGGGRVGWGWEGGAVQTWLEDEANGQIRGEKKKKEEKALSELYIIEQLHGS